MSSSMWDQRYAPDRYFYGTEPNAFLKDRAGVFGPAPKKVLCLAEGEGRNGVHLASLGHRVTGVDASSAGRDKALRLAREREVPLDYDVADLSTYELGKEQWDGVVSVFCHLPTALRADVHRRVVAALRPGGVVLLEAYTPQQLRFATGGPKDPEMLYTAELLRRDFEALEVLHLEEFERDVSEGAGHTGHAAVVQLIARRRL